MRNTKLVVTDVDGVLTPGTFLYDRDGKVMKEFGPHDADGLRLLRQRGVEVQAITADHRGLAITRARLEDMGIPLAVIGENDREGWFGMCDAETTAYIGDGYYDVPLLRRAAVSFAPSDACMPARMAAKIVLDTPGGRGVLLEVALRLGGAIL